MLLRNRFRSAVFFCLFLPLLLTACDGDAQPLGLTGNATTPTSFPEASYDYLHAMDHGLALTPEEVRDRNPWIIWTADNNARDYLSRHSFGAFDLLKVIDSVPDANGLWLRSPGGTEDHCYAEAYHESFPREQFTRVYGAASCIVRVRAGNRGPLPNRPQATQ
jgi:hypothetical protein